MSYDRMRLYDAGRFHDAELPDWYHEANRLSETERAWARHGEGAHVDRETGLSRIDLDRDQDRRRAARTRDQVHRSGAPTDLVANGNEVAAAASDTGLTRR